MTDAQDNVSQSEKVPGRTTGFAILSALVLITAIWMNYQSGLLQVDQFMPPATQHLDAAAGFNSEAWHLPGDELLGFVEIPAGSFTMGSNPALDRQAYENERWSSTRRQGTVDIPRFYIAKFEVTVAQYRAFIEDTGHPFDEQAMSAPPNHPVTRITWPDALTYSRWLESKLRAWEQTPSELQELLNSDGQVVLPTEAEWEKAARGTDSRVFPWGSQVVASNANFDSTATTEVGSFSCNECAHGLADMSGNVWELTRSPFQDYPYTRDDDREGLSEDALWVMRGGSFSDSAANIRTAVRGGVDPGVRNETIGFRVVISSQ
jgi:formylglycine-generating enzyme required for sulfatase activity